MNAQDHCESKLFGKKARKLNGRSDAVPKTVGDLIELLVELDPDTPIMKNRGNQTYEPLNKWAGLRLQSLQRLGGPSKVHIDTKRWPSMGLKTKPKEVVTFG